MNTSRHVFIGTDGGATTSKIAAVWADGSPVSTDLLQRPTGSEHGPIAVMEGPYLWPTQRRELRVVPAVLGDLSQAIGAALVALYRAGDGTTR